jgi:hypothetical protein
MLFYLSSFTPFLADAHYYPADFFDQLLRIFIEFGAYCLLVVASLWLLAQPLIWPGRPRRSGWILLLCGVALLIEWHLSRTSGTVGRRLWQYPPLILMGLALAIAGCERLWPANKQS